MGIILWMVNSKRGDRLSISAVILRLIALWLERENHEIQCVGAQPKLLVVPGRFIAGFAFIPFAA
jgi:hypothetical protein